MRDLDAYPEPGSATALVEEEIIAMSVLNFERMPMLDLIFERFVLSLAKAFRSFTSAPTETELADLHYTVYDQAMLSLGEPCLIAIAEIAPWGAPVAVAMDSAFLYSALEVIMGGRASGAEKTARGFTRIETRIAERLCDLALKDLAASFAQVADISFAIRRMEGTAQLATITRPTAPCVRADFAVSFGGPPGTLSVILPHASLEPIRAPLTKVFYGDRLGGDSEWRGHLSSRIHDSSMPVTAVLTEIQRPLAEVLGWAPGQVIDLGVTETAEAVLVCAGTAIARGPSGQRDTGATAIRVTEVLGSVEAIAALLGTPSCNPKGPR